MNSAMEVTNSYSLHSATCSTNVDHETENMVTQTSNTEQVKSKNNFSPEEIRNIMEAMAATGKFWHDWDTLKDMLSFWMKQVLAEYPESQTDSTDEAQKSSLVGETYPELVKRLDEALLSFVEGPPFTLQRLCEILLAPKSTYTKLSKLSLALEKNLLVTSTLTISTEPYPGAVVQKCEPENDNDNPQEKCIPVPNGIETTAGDADEEMTDAEADDDTTIADTEMIEKVSETSSDESETVPDSNTFKEIAGTNEQQRPST